jgi:DNA polymerase elongation subunit (family B)
MRLLYFDIETVAVGDEQVAQAALSPATARIDAVTLYDVARETGVVYLHPRSTASTDNAGWKIKYAGEREMLTEFWEGIPSYDGFIGYGIRQFDIPFLTHRSLVQQLRPLPLFRQERNPARQTFPKIVDLQDEFSFYGRQRPALTLRELGLLNHLSIAAIAPDYEHMCAWQSAADATLYLQHCQNKAMATVELYDIWLQNLASPEYINSIA